MESRAPWKGDRLGWGWGGGGGKEEQPGSAGPGHGRMEGPAGEGAQETALDTWDAPICRIVAVLAGRKGSEGEAGARNSAVHLGGCRQLEGACEMSHQAPLGRVWTSRPLLMERVKVCRRLQGQPRQSVYSGRGAPGASVCLPDKAAQGNAQGWTRDTSFTKEAYCLHGPGGPGRRGLSHWQTQVLRGGAGRRQCSLQRARPRPSMETTSEPQPSPPWCLSAPLQAHHGDSERRPMGAHG